jgi:beta-lactam-binding protein with PASTA domain
MKKLIGFIKTKKFWLHGFLASLSAIIFLWLFFQCMSLYTDHNEEVIVPDFKGQSILNLEDFIEDKDVNFKIIDSIYKPDEKLGIVFDQDPQPNGKVKNNRTIYLYVTSLVPPQIIMPKLIDRSLRQAISMIESYGLKIGSIKYVTDPCMNCVLKQLAEGNTVEPGTYVKKGTQIDLDVGKGQDSNEKATIINVVGNTYCDAKAKLLSSGLKIGAIISDAKITDTCSAFVYKQIPSGYSISEVAVGSSVDVYITTDASKVTEQNNDAEKNTIDDEE